MQARATAVAVLLLAKQPRCRRLWAGDRETLPQIENRDAGPDAAPRPSAMERASSQASLGLGPEILGRLALPPRGWPVRLPPYAGLP